MCLSLNYYLTEGVTHAQKLEYIFVCTYGVCLHICLHFYNPLIYQVESCMSRMRITIGMQTIANKEMKYLKNVIRIN